MNATIYNLLADLTLSLHLLFVAFVIISLFLILLGKILIWPWVRNPTFRIIHLGCISVVVLQTWLGRLCPLTILEMELRSRAGDSTYAGSFISHWLETLLYYNAPGWVFILCYSVFGLAVIASWFWVRPGSFHKNS